MDMLHEPSWMLHPNVSSVAVEYAEIDRGKGVPEAVDEAPSPPAVFPQLRSYRSTGSGDRIRRTTTPTTS